MKKLTRRRVAPLICGIVLACVYAAATIAVIMLYLCSPAEGGAWQRGLFTAATAAAGLIALPLTMYSTFIMYFDIRRGAYCTKRMAHRGARQLAEIMNGFTPSYLIFVQGNSERLYNDYIRAYAVPTKTVLSLPASLRYQSPPVTPACIMTKKFYIDAQRLAVVSTCDRVIIFDDVTKTGDTVKQLKSYLQGTLHVPDQNILTCGFIVDEYGFAQCAEPAFYFMRAKVKDDYGFPWRRG